MVWQVLDWIARIGVVLGAVGVAWIGKKSAERAETVKANAAPYDKLADRVSTLETAYDSLRRRHHRLESDLDLVVDTVHEQIEWQDSGATPPPRLIKAHVRELVARRRLAREA